MGRVAITGGIATGKSTVLEVLQQQGYTTASADSFAREVFLLPEVQKELSLAVGIPRPIEAADLRRAILADTRVRRTVNRITHPRILARIQACTEQFIEVPLLIETCLQGRFRAVWVVVCDPQTQLERLQKKLGDAAQAAKLIAAQLPLDVKTPFADLTVRTNDPPATVQRYVRGVAGDFID